MHDKIMKMMMAKKKSSKDSMSENEKNAKMGVVKDMQDMAKKAMSDSLPGMKKVTVAADSAPDLKEGLEKAKEIVGQMPEENDMEEEGSDEEESSEGSSEELTEIASDIDHLDMSDLDKLSKIIEEKKKQKMMEQA